MPPPNSTSAPYDFKFRRVAILGCGLLGGSFALALRKHLPEARIIAFDRAEVLGNIRSNTPNNLPAKTRADPDPRHLFDESTDNLSQALLAADLVYIALPISSTIELLPEIARLTPVTALVTDACSTKRAVCRMAAPNFQDRALFLGGHPMAGGELPGIAHADAEIFRGAKYALIGDESDSDDTPEFGGPSELGNPAAPAPAHDPRIASFLALLDSMGATPVWLDAETHDWAAAIMSHLPQLAAVALAGLIAEETDESGLPASLAGSGARSMLRLAGSPYAMWRDIAFTNSDNLSRALDRLAQAVDHLRTQLTTRDLERSFAAANDLHKKLLP